MEDVIKDLAAKAKKTIHSHEALQFTQAACNLANALRVLADTEIAKREADRRLG